MGVLLATPFAALAAPKTTGLTIPINQTFTDAAGTTTATIQSLQVTELAFENGQLLLSGVLSGTTTTAGVTTAFTQTVTDVVANLFGRQQRCGILFLDLGPIFLDVLGLEIDLSQITLDIDAVAGPGNLLGNLLCAIVGLLDQGGPLAGITRLLDQINALL
jgi:hypothetical protein